MKKTNFDSLGFLQAITRDDLRKIVGGTPDDFKPIGDETCVLQCKDHNYSIVSEHPMNQGCVDTSIISQRCGSAPFYDCVCN